MTVDLAFIGAGGIARNQHFETLEGRDDADVVAICDIDADAATSAAERFDAEAFTDYRALFDGVDLDAVFVCLPPFAHGEQEREAVERGIDCFIEKPLGLTMDTVTAVLDALDDADVIAQVGYNWRYSRGVERAQELLADRSIGYVDGYWWGGVPQGEDGWWRHVDRSGGQILEQATHIFDTVRLLAGDVERVSAAGSHRLESLVDFPDSTSATMEHTAGAVSHVTTSCSAEEGKVGLEVVAEDATLTIRQSELTGSVDGESIEESYDRNPYAAEVDAFLEAVRTRDPSGVRSPYADATETFRTTLAVTDAIETGDTVSLD